MDIKEKISKVLTEKTRSKDLVKELPKLTESQLTELTNFFDYYSEYPKNLVHKIKVFLKKNVRDAQKAAEKKEAYEKKYGKTVALFHHILKYHRTQIKKSITNSMNDNKAKYKEQWKKQKRKFTEELFKEEIQTRITLTVQSNEFKLIEAIHNYTGSLKVKTVKKIRSSFGAKGIEGIYTLTLEDGTKGNMHTRSITAGGYNIQCWHYRYIITLDKELQQKQDVTIDLQENELKVIKILINNMETIKPIQIPKHAVRKVLQLKNSSRNFSPLVKRGFISRRELGAYLMRRYEYFLTKKGAEVFNSLKGELK